MTPVFVDKKKCYYNLIRPNLFGANNHEDIPNEVRHYLYQAKQEIEDDPYLTRFHCVGADNEKFKNVGNSIEPKNRRNVAYMLDANDYNLTRHAIKYFNQPSTKLPNHEIIEQLTPLYNQALASLTSTLRLCALKKQVRYYLYSGVQNHPFPTTIDGIGTCKDDGRTAYIDTTISPSDGELFAKMLELIGFVGNLDVGAVAYNMLTGNGYKYLCGTKRVIIDYCHELFLMFCKIRLAEEVKYSV